MKDRYKTVADIGCGTGHALRDLASKSSLGVRFIGVEPAKNMRNRACECLNDFVNVRLIEGRFESLPLETNTVDFLYSVLAFHWTTDLERSLSELARVLKPDGEMDLFFPGRKTGHEFTKKTTPILLKYLGPAPLLESARLRIHLAKDTALELFAKAFPTYKVTVDESLETYYDDIDGHWSWWMSRAAGHFTKIPTERRKQCDEEVRQAIASLATQKGIPYTVHLLHVRVRA